MSATALTEALIRRHPVILSKPFAVPGRHASAGAGGEQPDANHAPRDG
jgi:hypothetical protein